MIARFTRDEASKYVWGVLTMAAIGGLVFATVHGGTVLAERRDAAQARAIGFASQLESRLDGSHPTVPITGQAADSLERAVESSILADERVSRVRLWSTDGTLLFSTERSDDPGSDAGLNDQVLRQASRQGVLTSSGISDTGGPDDPERALLRTYAPIGDDVVAEIDQTDQGTLAASRTAWRGYQFLAGGLIALFLLMTALSLRDPIERMNVGVPFAVSSIPVGYSLIDDERLDAVHEVYRLASERVANMQRKLEASEEARRRLEGDIQRSLSKAAATPTRTDPPVATPPPPHVVQEPVVQVPDSEVVEAKASDARAPALAGPLARATREQKSPSEATRKENPVEARPKRSPKRRKAGPEKQRAGAREVAVPTPKREPERQVAVATPKREPQRQVAAATPKREPERQVAAAASTPAPASPAVRPAASAPAAPSPHKIERTAASNGAAVAPPQPAAAAPSAATDDATAHAAALETFIRLTESDRQHHDMSTVDQGAVRAALARTAARKKPGGGRLQSHEGPPDESLGGPPNGRR